MASLRCSPCGVSWPITDKYALCPACNEKTWPSSAPPDEDANQRAFEAYYERREAKRAELEARLGAQVDEIQVEGD